MNRKNTQLQLKNLESKWNRFAGKEVQFSEQIRIAELEHYDEVATTDEFRRFSVKGSYVGKHN